MENGESGMGICGKRLQPRCCLFILIEQNHYD